MTAHRLPAPGDAFYVRCGGMTRGATILAAGVRTILMLIDGSKQVLELPNAGITGLVWFSDAGQA